MSGPKHAKHGLSSKVHHHHMLTLPVGKLPEHNDQPFCNELTRHAARMASGQAR